MKENGKIIQSLLDLDFYKLTMAQVVWRHFSDIPVKYSFKNRTASVNLTNYVSEEDLRSQIDYIQQLRFTEEEIDYLRENRYLERGFFSEEFLTFLRNLKLPDIHIERKKTKYEIEVKGLWSETILWETLILSVINELYFRSLLVRKRHCLNRVRIEGERRLDKKIEILKRNPLIKFVEFGTRRRFSRDWQKFVVKKLADKLLPEQFLGASNVLLAKELDLRPIGTFAHEMFMIFSGIYHNSDDDIRASHNKVLQVWWGVYGKPLSIALTDTYGSDFFFKDFTTEQACNWRGLRQDSGDPIEFGEKVIRFYQQKGINPKSKLILFSDGLNIETILKLVNYFAGRINVAFGWGTNLTNDCGYKALSLVVKPIEACGHPVIKLSDNIAKAIGDSGEIERLKRIFDYRADYNQPCIY